MYVVRLKSIDSIFNFKSFASRPLAQRNFETGQDRVIDEGLDECALFAASTNDPRIAAQLVRDGRGALLQIYPRPMTKEQAAAWLENLYL
jgi:hypothetical protein